MTDQTFLRDLRDAAGYTQDQAASFVGVSQAAISGWEAGRVPLPDAHARLLGRLYGVEEAEVLDAAEVSRSRWFAQRDLRFASGIRSRREGAGLTREQLAEAADVTSGAVALWEDGVVRPTRERMALMVDLFGVEIEALLAEAGLDADEIAAYIAEPSRDLTPLAVLLRSGREAAELTQQQVAAAAGVAQNTVSAMELSHHMPNRAVLRKLQTLYGLSDSDVRSALYQSRVRRGLVPEVTLPWPLEPDSVPRTRWFRQLRAHLGLTLPEVATHLGIPVEAARDCERPQRTGLPDPVLRIDVSKRLAALGQTTARRLLVAYEPVRAEGLEELLELEGSELVDSCSKVMELVRILNLRGVSWTDMGNAAGTSREAPRLWAAGSSVPSVSKVRALAFFIDGAEADDLKQLRQRDKAD